MFKGSNFRKKVVSSFSTLTFSSAVLFSSAPIAAAASFTPTTITVGTTDTKSGNGNATYWLEYLATGTGTLTVDTCSSTGSTNQVVTLFESSAQKTDDTQIGSALTSASSTTCSGGFTKNYSVTNSKYYYIKLETAGNHSVKTTLSFAIPPTYVELDRVTICHRTHATTNPYRIITVSTSSIVAANGDIRGHGKHATDARRYNPNLYGVYDSTRNYASNAKLWGDIIPPFKDKSTGATFAGLNWSWGSPTATTESGKQVFTKSSFTTVATGSSNATHQAAVNKCTGAEGNLTAKQFFDLERGKGGLSKTEILDEIAETDEFETDPANKEKSGVESQLPAREGPKRQPSNQISQSLAGIVWMDLNRNGFQEDNEPNMSNIRVTVQQGTAPVSMGGAFSGFGTGAKVFTDIFGANIFTTAIDTFSNKFTNSVNWIRNLFGMATTYTVYTDISGAYLFKSIDSGDWYVSGVVPTGLEVTYDSLGTNDAIVDTSVPAGGSAFTWIGLVGTNSNTGINSLVQTPSGGNATDDVVLTFSGADGIFCNTDDINYVITPVNGVITVSGIPAGTYYVRQIGSTGTIADVTITNGQTYSTTITTTAGVRCDVLTESELFAASSSGGSGSGGTTRASQVLANTGNALGGLPGVSLFLLLAGAGAVFAAVKLERKFKS